MTAFQLIALILTAIWLVMVVVRFRRSNVVLIGGLLVIGLCTLTAFIFEKVTPAERNRPLVGNGKVGAPILIGAAAFSLYLILSSLMSGLLEPGIPYSKPGEGGRG